MWGADHYLILNGVIVILLLIYFLGFRGKNTPSRLNFKKVTSPTHGGPQIRSESLNSSLNIFFNYNGHSFDAYEVLGVPAGSTLEEIHNIYQKNLAVADPASREFFRVAFEAVREHHRKSRS